MKREIIIFLILLIITAISSVIFWPIALYLYLIDFIFAIVLIKDAIKHKKNKKDQEER